MTGAIRWVKALLAWTGRILWSYCSPMKIESAKQESPPVVITLSAQEAKDLANELYVNHPAGNNIAMTFMYALRTHFGMERFQHGQVK